MTKMYFSGSARDSLPQRIAKPQASCSSSRREARGSAGADPQRHVPRLLCLRLLGSEDLRPAGSGCLEDQYVWCPAWWERGGKDLVEDVAGRKAGMLTHIVVPVGKCSHLPAFPKCPVIF